MHDNAAEQSLRRAPLRRRAATAFICALCLLGAAAATASTATTASTAGPGGQPLPAALQVAQAEEKVSLSQATRMVRERTGGQVLRAETKRSKGRTVHRIRVLTEDGRVRTWHVDAESGRVY